MYKENTNDLVQKNTYVLSPVSFSRVKYLDYLLPTDTNIIGFIVIPYFFYVKIYPNYLSFTSLIWN